MKFIYTLYSGYFIMKTLTFMNNSKNCQSYYNKIDLNDIDNKICNMVFSLRNYILYLSNLTSFMTILGLEYF